MCRRLVFFGILFKAGPMKGTIVMMGAGAVSVTFAWGDMVWVDFAMEGLLGNEAGWSAGPIAPAPQAFSTPARLFGQMQHGLSRTRGRPRSRDRGYRPRVGLYRGSCPTAIVKVFF